MLLRENGLRKRLREGDVALGATVQTASPEAVEMVGHAGYDFVWIDAEHGTIDLGMLVHMLRAAEACGLASIVRVPDQTPSFITRTLDAGASGVLVPHVRTRAEAEAIVRAAKYGPWGERGACPSTRSTGHSAEDWPAFVEHADRDTMVWGLIEDPDGVANIEEIVSVPGLDAILFGPFDLSQALGYHGDVGHPDVTSMHERVSRAARGSGVDLVSLVRWEPGGFAGARSRGARIVVDGNDRRILSEGYRATLRTLDAAFRQSRPSQPASPAVALGR